MHPRYTRSAMKNIWSERKKYETWLDVEILVLEAYAAMGYKITSAEVQKIKAKAVINIKRIAALEAKTKHDVIAFTRAISEPLGPEKRWIHYGLTATDVVDTAQSIRIQAANKIILEDLLNLHATIKKLALKYKKTYQIGRTHGVHAEVTTFGYKMALWYDEISRNIERFKVVAQQVEVAKISGAVGNYASVPPEVQDYVARKRHLLSSKISTQTLQRDRHANYIFIIALIASSLDKFATEIRHLQKTEVQEVAEGFVTNQKGSSAMPHKKNPIASENISGLARILRGFVVAASENIALWHERDISHSSAERIIIASATALLDYMINRFKSVLDNLYVSVSKMKTNIMNTRGVVFSHRALLLVIDKNGWSREKAYNQIQKIAETALVKNLDFGQLLVRAKLLSQEEVKSLYNLDYYSKNIDKVFRRLHLE